MPRTTTPDLCPRFHAAVELIGRRWTGAILYLLLQSPAGFAQLRDGIPGINERMLAERLRDLEKQGVISRSVRAGPPVRVHYAATPKGRSLAGVFEAVSRWSHKWVPLPAASGKPKPARRRAQGRTTRLSARARGGSRRGPGTRPPPG